MNLRKYKNMFKEKLNKKDMIRLLKNSVICIFLYGILIGVLSNLLLHVLNVPISFELIAISFVVSSAVAKSYYCRHILYPILSIVIFVLTLFVVNFTYIFVMTLDFSNILTILNLSLHQTIHTFNPFVQFEQGVFGILNYAILIIILYYTFERSKNNYY